MSDVKSEIQVRDISPRIASEVSLSKETLIAGTHAAQLRQLLSERGVLIMRNAHFDDEEQQAFTRTLGTPMAQTEREEVMKRQCQTNGAECARPA